MLNAEYSGHLIEVIVLTTMLFVKHCFKLVSMRVLNNISPVIVFDINRCFSKQASTYTCNKLCLYISSRYKQILEGCNGNVYRKRCRIYHLKKQITYSKMS